MIFYTTPVFYNLFIIYNLKIISTQPFEIILSLHEVGCNLCCRKRNKFENLPFCKTGVVWAKAKFLYKNYFFMIATPLPKKHLLSSPNSTFKGGGVSQIRIPLPSLSSQNDFAAVIILWRSREWPLRCPGRVAGFDRYYHSSRRQIDRRILTLK